MGTEKDSGKKEIPYHFLKGKKEEILIKGNENMFLFVSKNLAQVLLSK
jgi:hypothetical protein